MAFGTVVVQTESGEQQEYELTKPTTSVGRQSGNDIVLNTTAASRYHAQFDVAEGQVFLVDLGSVNGTFVNDEQIEPNSRVVLNEGDVITLGDVCLTFFPRQFRSGISLTPQASLIEDPELAFQLVLDEPLQPVAPGARLQLALVIENLSAIEQVYTVELGGMDPEWAKANRREVRLGPVEKSEVLITIRPPRSGQTRPGVYALTVQVALKDDPTQMLEVVREIDVVGYSELGMDVQPGEQRGLFYVAVHNLGNTPLHLKLGGYNPDRLLRYRFEPPEVHLDPGASQQVALTVHPARSGAAGRAQPIPFAVVGRSLDLAGYQAPVLAYYQPTSSSPAWLAGLVGLPLLLMVAAALIVVTVAVLYFRGFTPGSGPGKEPAGAAEAQLGESPEAALTEVPLPTPTLIVIPPTPTPTPTPTSTVPPTPTVSTPGAVLQFKSGLEVSVEVIFGQVRDVAFIWEVPEGEAEETVLMGEDNRQISLTEDEIAAGQRRVELEELVRSFGWDERVYTLGITMVDEDIAIYEVVLAVRPVVCVVQDAKVVYNEPGLHSRRFSPLPATEVVIAGRYLNPVEDHLWLRVAAFDPDDLELIAPHNQRWIPATQVVSCDGEPVEDFDEYVLLEGEPIPRP